MYHEKNFCQRRTATVTCVTDKNVTKPADMDVGRSSRLDAGCINSEHE